VNLKMQPWKYKYFISMVNNDIYGKIRCDIYPSHPEVTLPKHT